MLKSASGWLVSSLGYLLYGAGLLVLLLWLLFPKETMRRMLEERLNRAGTGLQWRVGAVALEMPPGLTMRGIEGSVAKEGKVPFVWVEGMTLRPHLVESLRSRSLEAGYRLTIAKGSIDGRVRYSDGKTVPWVAGTLQDIRLADIPLLSRQLGRTLSGTVSGTFAGSFASGREGMSNVEARVSVENGRLGLKRRMLSHNEIPVTEGTVLLHGQGETLHLEQGTVDSELLSAQFSGMITLHRDPALSQIDVKGTMLPKNKFYKGLDNTIAVQAFRMQLKDNPLPFRITGDLSNPGIHFEEYALLFQTMEKELK
jgi:type II secretion system protein N